MTGGVPAPEVLFVCVHNAGRSQMAEAFLNHYARGRVRGVSAGTEPGADLNPTVVQAMAEVGVDMSGHRPKPLTPEMVERAAMVITMGCGVAESCPAGFLRIDADWGLEDPKGQPIEKVREIRDSIRAKVLALLKTLEGV